MEQEKKDKIKFNILAIVCIMIFCCAICPITLQNDTYYTIKIGEYVLENGVTMEDPFSWHEGLIYTFPHWAYDVCISLIYNLGGQLGIYISTLILASILGIVIYLTNVKLNKNRIISFLLTIGVMYMLRDFIAARAQTVTFILFALTIFFIEMFLETKKKRYAVGLIIIPIIIANFHAAVWPFYFVLYLPYLAEYILMFIADSDIFYYKILLKIFNKKLKTKKLDEDSRNKIVEKILKNEKNIEKHIHIKQKKRKSPYKLKIEKNNNVKTLLIIFLICTLTGLLTPQITEPYTHLVKLMKGTTTNNINEHLPLTLIQSPYYLCILIVFLSILIFTDTKIRLKDLFMLGGLCYLSLKSRRQISIFVLICAYILNRFLTELFNKYDAEEIEKFEKKVIKIEGQIITILLILIISIMMFKPKINDKFINEVYYPVAASDFIIKNLDLKSIKIFNEYNYGSYLLFRGIPVFVDSRADLYSPEFNKDVYVFNDFLLITGFNVNYESKFNEYGITHVILYRNSRLNILLEKDRKYRVIYSDPNFILYEREGVNN